jgi:hypothetical protein
MQRKRIFALTLFALIDPARNQCFLPPTHFRKRRGNGWGMDTVSKGRMNKKPVLQRLDEQ